MLTRRDVAVRSVGAMAGGIVAGRLSWSAAAQQPESMRPQAAFSFDDVIERARVLAASQFSREFPAVPGWLADLDRDDYLRVRYRPEAAVWRGDNLPFQIQLFHRGFIYERPVRINLLEGGTVRELRYSSDQFDFGPGMPGDPLPADTGFSGFRLHAPINLEGIFDEVAVFQGGNAFRAIGKGQVYGLSARSVALDAATGRREDVPFFREFWIERPAPSSDAITVYGLLDGESLTGACKFVVRPGEATEIAAHVTLFMRRDVEKLGLAPLVSMFLYGEDASRPIDDVRPEIHDSDGLLMRDGAGVWTWRPLRNPGRLAISAFAFPRLSGFGLMQRDRDFRSYQDLDALFQQRPSAWVELSGDWGPGRLELVEVPADAEIYDNIICYWVPDEPVSAGQTWTVDYRVWFGRGAGEPSALGLVMSTRSGRGAREGSRRLMVDFAGGQLADLREMDSVQAEITVSNGRVDNIVRRKNAFSGGVRLTFDFYPEADTSEIRAVLTQGGERLTETWSYQWQR